MNTGDRVHQLAQAAQVGDLLAERVDEYFEMVHRAAVEVAKPDGDHESVRTMLAAADENLQRALAAYRTVRS